MELLREVRAGGFVLWLETDGTCDNRGCETVYATLWDEDWTEGGDDSAIFEDYGPFHGSPLHATDSDEAVCSVMLFLSLRPDDTDADYFDGYTERQLAWCDARAEELAMLAEEPGAWDDE